MVTLEGGGNIPNYGAMIVLERVGGESSPYGESLSGMSPFVEPSGSFSVDGIAPGTVYLDVNLQALNNQQSGEGNFYIKSITTPNGADLLREPINVTSETDMRGVRIVLARGAATLTGRVLAEAGGAIVRGANVTLIPADARRWSRRSARSFGFADALGQFTATVAPGEYLIFVERQGSAMNFDENRIRTRANRAARVTLAPNERRSMDVIIAAAASGN